MREIDPGHIFELHTLDDETQGHDRLRFVKREGPGYPGNVGHHAGTNMQDVLRALIERTKYVDNQIPDADNLNAIKAMRQAIFYFERRAAVRHGRAVLFSATDIENQKVCEKCGHIQCGGKCRRSRT